jgi:hypothetical protein
MFCLWKPWPAAFQFYSGPLTHRGFFASAFPSQPLSPLSRKAFMPALGSLFGKVSNLLMQKKNSQAGHSRLFARGRQRAGRRKPSWQP